MSESKSISAESFLKINRDSVTVLDVREPDEQIVYPVEGALSMPFSDFIKEADKVPSDKPVYVICNTGDLSEQVAEILAERGYDATNVSGGVQEIRKITETAEDPDPSAGAGHEENEEKGAAGFGTHSKEASVPDTVKSGKKDNSGASSVSSANKIHYVDARGMKCPGPIVKVGDAVRAARPGDKICVEATEDAFASDIAVWCERTGNRLVSLKVKDGLIKASLVKSRNPAKAGPVNTAHKESSSSSDSSSRMYTDPREHEKTFVVFSGDLDKTLAAFIMANTAAAMGRNVTMFFTFWGLNVLRRPEKVKVKKDFIGKMFGMMMPRGSKKLGLSRMNMFGAGAKMIRAVMKKNGIASLEQLMQSAIKHGVRIVACQMSMDIMGIKKEELLDGVELGGAATMLGSAEKSDLTYFI